MSPWSALTALSLATFILTHLVVTLDFPPVLWLRRKVVGGWRPPTMKETYHPSYPRGELDVGMTMAPPGLPLCSLDDDGEIRMWDTRSDRVPFFFAELMSCPWCAGGWIAAAVTAGASLTVGVPAPVLMWLASWALGSLLASRDWV